MNGPDEYTPFPVTAGTLVNAAVPPHVGLLGPKAWNVMVPVGLKPLARVAESLIGGLLVAVYVADVATVVMVGSARKHRSRPTPVTLSTPAGATSTAVAFSRAVARAVVLSPGRASRTRASQAAAWGAATDVPPKGDPKPPTPVTCTLSAAPQVGPWVLVRPPPAAPTHGGGSPAVQTVVEPSCTGPPPLKPSMPPPTASMAADEVAAPV